jgi:trimeric autotransporter adhesin
MKTWKTVLLLLGLALVKLAIGDVSAQSAFTATYDFSGVLQDVGGTTDPTPPPIEAGLTFSSFTSAGADANPNAGGRFSFQSQPLGATNGVDDFSQFTGSLSVTAYFEVSITPVSAIEMQLDTIAFTVQRSGTGIRSYAVRSSVDGFAANLPASISPGNVNLGVGPGNEFRVLVDTVTTAQNGSLVILGLPYSSAPVTFRFYGWNAESTVGTFSIDNVSFSGSTRGAVPEPTTASFLLLGLASLGIYHRRKLKE